MMKIDLPLERIGLCRWRQVLMVLLTYAVTLSSPQGALAQTGQRPTLFPVCRDGMCGYIDDRGKLSIDLGFEEVGRFVDGLAPVRLVLKWGYIDEKGQIVISVQFAAAREFSEGLAPVQIGSKWGYIDRAGRVIIEPQFDEASSFSLGFARVRAAEQWIYIDSSGNRCSIRFWGAPDFTEGLAAAVDGDKIGYVDSKLSWSIRPQFKDGGRFSSGCAPVKVGEKWGFIDRTGSFVIAPKFLTAESFSEGLAAVSVDINRQGYIDKSGTFVIVPTLRDAGAFSEGLAPVIYTGHFVKSRTEHTGFAFVGGRWGYIKSSGKVVIRLSERVDYAGAFLHGLAFVRLKDGRYGYIDKQGRYLWYPSK